jgi:hypothetical protein
MYTLSLPSPSTLSTSIGSKTPKDILKQYIDLGSILSSIRDHVLIVSIGCCLYNAKEKTKAQRISKFNAPPQPWVSRFLSTIEKLVSPSQSEADDNIKNQHASSSDDDNIKNQQISHDNIKNEQVWKESRINHFLESVVNHDKFKLAHPSLDYIALFALVLGLTPPPSDQDGKALVDEPFVSIHSGVQYSLISEHSFRLGYSIK